MLLVFFRSSVFPCSSRETHVHGTGFESSSQLSGRLHLLGSSRTVDGATKVPQGSPQQELPTTMESQKLRILVNAAPEVEQAAATPPVY